MSFIGNDRETKERIGRRLKVFREKIMKRTQTTFPEFAAKVKIPLSKLKNMEAGIFFPEADELVMLRSTFGLNINWLFGSRDNIYCFMDKEREEVFNSISAKIIENIENRELT